MSLDIVPCAESHLAALTDIYNEVIRTSTAIYADEPVSIEQRRAWSVERVAQGYPIWVALQHQDVVGFATFGDFRGSWPGYRFTVEHTVHVRAGVRGAGIGTVLMQRLIRSANDLGKHVMIGAIDADNHPSIRFHERLGFAQAARLPEVGTKFGRWLDLVLMHKILNVRTPSHGATGLREC